MHVRHAGLIGCFYILKKHPGDTGSKRREQSRVELYLLRVPILFSHDPSIS
jgi:hypothetical protein